MASITSSAVLSILRRSRITRGSLLLVNNHNPSIAISRYATAPSRCATPMLSTRSLSTSTNEKNTTPQDETTSKETPPASETEATDAKTPPPPEQKKDPTPEEKLRAEVKDLKDKLLRSYAEQENIRRIAKNDVASARNFAVSSFAKSLLDTSDNLSRAMDAVPQDHRTDKENHPELATLFEGIKMTDDGLTKAFEKNGLKKYGAVGDKFDPNFHEALFEYPDAKMEPGTLGQIMKAGFMLKGRSIRSAEVGVIKKP